MPSEPAEQNKFGRRSHLTPIYVAAGMLRAQVIKGKLEASGIPVLLDYESIGPIIGITVDGLGQVRILVPDEYVDEAHQLLQEEPPEEEETSN